MRGHLVHDVSTQHGALDETSRAHDDTGTRAIRVPRLIAGMAFLLLAIAVFGLCIVHGLFVDRDVDVEEVVLLNPVFTYAQQGRSAFPAFAFMFGPRLYETFAAHPSVHYDMVGLGLRLGASLRVAEALPIATSLVLAVVLLATSGLPRLVSLGMLFGIGAALALCVAAWPNETFSARPELHLALTWVGGLLALEGGRRHGWDGRRLFVGALLVTVGSAMQWFAVGGFLGVLSYMVAVARQSGPRRAFGPLLAMMAGGAIFGIPHVILFFLPNRELINTLADMGLASGPLQLWAGNFEVYAYLRDVFWNMGVGNWASWTAGPVAAVMALRVPPFLTAAALLWFAAGRPLAFAAIPLPAWGFLVSNHKGYYYIPEITLVLVAVGAAVGMLLELVMRRVPNAWVRSTATLAMAVGVAAVLVASSPGLAKADFRYGPLPHPVDVARKAGVSIVGPDALLASAHQLWYIGGARYWHDFTRSTISDPQVDPRRYLTRFDAVADNPYWIYSVQSLVEAPRNTSVLALYAEGTLQLRGFVSDVYSYNIFSPQAGPEVRGYARRGQALFEFISTPDGQHILATVVCPLAAGRPEYAPLIRDTGNLAAPGSTDVDLSFEVAQAFVPLAAMGTPDEFTKPAGPPASMRGVVVSRGRFAELSSALGPGCSIRDQTSGTLSNLDVYRFAQRLTREEQQQTAYYTADAAIAAKGKGAPQ